MKKGYSQFVLVLICLSYVLPMEGKHRSAPKLWKTFCISCHGAEGKGDVPTGVALAVPDLTTADFAQSSGAHQIRERIREGKKNEKGVMRMIAYKHLLKEKELEELVDYVSALNENRISDEKE